MTQRTIEELKAEGYSSMQIYIIRQGYELNIDPSPYMDPKFRRELLKDLMFQSMH